MSARYAHPNAWRLANRLNRSTELLEAAKDLLASPEFQKFANAETLARLFAEEAAHNRRAIAEEWPSNAPRLEAT